MNQAEADVIERMLGAVRNHVYLEAYEGDVEKLFALLVLGTERYARMQLQQEREMPLDAPRSLAQMATDTEILSNPDTFTESALLHSRILQTLKAIAENLEE